MESLRIGRGLLATALCFGPFITLPVSALADNQTPVQNVQGLVNQWRMVRPTLNASSTKAPANSPQAVLIADYDATLNKTGQTLERIVPLLRSTDPKEKAQLPALFDELKAQLVKLQTLRVKLNGDAEFTRKSGQLFGIVSNVIKEQHNITGSTVRNLRY
jgi:hypothetical protein